MNLFLSFILRATIFLIKDQIFISGVGPYDNFDGNQESVFCKLFLALFHYTLMANYCWILMEGLYLHSLVFHALSNDNSSISKYTVMGWGLPLVFIVPWTAARAVWENKLCWTTNVIAWHLWIIRGPITVSIVVNFFLFVNITRVLFVKMFVSQTPMAKRYKYRKWFKSTLVLVPLFGSHYSFLLLVSIAAELLSPQVEVYWMYIDQTFSSFQGVLVALLYCFFNTEVNESMRQLSRRNPQMIYIRRVLSASRRQPPEADGRTCPRGAIRRSRSMENSCERSDFFVHDHSSNPFARKLSTTSFTDAILVHPLGAGHCNLLQVMPEVHVLTTESSKAAREGML
ncbi:secretin receptor-like [Galendromus occidentalis]|uniref:Secretin receptor-like n=1 Tax=Galendromus occidentalis TaxID=34638 RepID=A0AAJ7L496_9ACAR|nr:secretin receptor-like [Galendromus occidentalis]